MATQRFIIVATTRSSAVRKAVETKAAEDGSFERLEIDEDVWLAAYDGTTRQLAEELGIRGGEAGSGIVCAISSYSGRQPTDVWEWLRIHQPGDG